MIPCGFAAGIDGVLPQAGLCDPPENRRESSAAAPIRATIRPKMSDTLNIQLLLVAHTLTEANVSWN
jgi:hypothetical protein